MAQFVNGILDVSEASGGEAGPSAPAETGSGEAGPSNPVDVSSSHATLVSIFVILAVILVMVEVSGISHQTAEWCLLILFAAVILRGLSTKSSTLTSFLEKYPYIP